MKRNKSRKAQHCATSPRLAKTYKIDNVVKRLYIFAFIKYNWL